MTIFMPEELVRAEQLMYNAKFEEALKIIENLEKKKTLTPNDQLSTLSLKGRIYFYNEQYRDAVKIGGLLYELSQEFGSLPESIYALVLKSYIGDTTIALKIILEAEKVFNSIEGTPNLDLSTQRMEILSRKSWLHFHKGNLDKAIESAKQCLSLLKKRDNKLEIGSSFYLFGYIYWYLLEFDTAFDYAMKSLDIMEELDFPRGIAYSSTLVSNIYLAKGDFNQALIFCKKSSSIKEISNRTKLTNFNLFGAIHYQKGDINKSLKYYNHAKLLAEKVNHPDQLALSLYQLGYVNRMKGDYDKAIEFNEASLRLATKIKYPYVICMSLVVLILVYLDKDSIEQAQQYLGRLKRLSDLIQQKYFNNMYLLSKALILKRSGRTSNRSEAEVILRKIVKEFAFFYPEPRFQALINLCDLYLEDLKLSNNLEILEDINPVITQLLDLAEQLHSYLYLAATKLLQAKLALLQINIPKAKQLLVEAQRVAEFQGLDLLARKISDEHDILLTQLDEWEILKKKKAPISDLMKLISLEEITEVMLQKRGIKPPELIDETPMLLLIIAEGGILAFSKSFTEEYSLEDDSISKFLTFLNTFREQIFTEGLDRTTYGKHTVLLEALDSFSVCYLFKGQSYIAKQKLAQFTESIRNTMLIWQVFQNFLQTHHTIKLSENPLLESLIIEIFVKKTFQVTIGKVAIYEEKKICLVCRNENISFAYICKCGAIYCNNCARALMDLENVCWLCERPIDKSKPVKPILVEGIEEGTKRPDKKK